MSKQKNLRTLDKVMVQLKTCQIIVQNCDVSFLKLNKMSI